MYQTNMYEGQLAETVTMTGHQGDVINAYFARPLGPGPFPAMVLIHHMPGWDEWYRETTRRFAHHGYLALSPQLPELEALRDACTFVNRILGFINAPAVWQWVMVEAADIQIDPRPYQQKRDLLWNGLTRMGYEVTKPRGTFYMFPKSPIPDDMAFVRRLMDEGILAVPGLGFGRSGYIRLSLTIPFSSIERSLPGFEHALHRL